MITLRPALPSDCRLLWEWRNAPEVRAKAFDSNPIEWEHHRRWFKQKLSDSSTSIYIATTADGETAGQIRFDVVESEATVAVIVARAVRGRGIGTDIIRKGTLQFASKVPGVNIVAEIKPDNEASLRAFKRAGYASFGGDDHIMRLQFVADTYPSG